MLLAFAEEYYKLNSLGDISVSMKRKIRIIQECYSSGKTPIFCNARSTGVSITQIIFEKYKKQIENETKYTT